MMWWLLHGRVRERPFVVLLMVLFGLTLNLSFLAMWWVSAFRDWALGVTFNGSGEAGLEGVLFHLALALWGWGFYKLVTGAQK